jgi:hypothetical protein
VDMESIVKTNEYFQVNDDQLTSSQLHVMTLEEKEALVPLECAVTKLLMDGFSRRSVYFALLSAASRLGSSIYTTINPETDAQRENYRRFLVYRK